MKQWLEPQPVQVSDDLLVLVGGNRIVAEVLARRGITDAGTAKAFLNPDFYTPSSPYDLPHMERAITRILQARENGEYVGVWGDFDVDGQTATTLLVTAFQQMGLNTAYYIPHRQSEGHGITVEGILRFIAEYDLKLVVTCDTGIAEHEAIAAAKRFGVDVIVTDHHQLPDHLPDAYACVNPQMLPSGHPAFTLPGVGCAFKLVQALFEKTGNADRVNQFLDLVALGVVADVALLRGDARYLLQIGLQALRKTPRLGLQMMIKNAKLDAAGLNEGDIAFALAPRLNALGRLSDANIAVELLSTGDTERAQLLADRLEAYNQERRQITDQVFEAALAQIEQDASLLNYATLVLAHPGWPGGVLGIVANKLVESFNRPVVLFSIAGEVARGSARSVEGCDITVAIASYSQYLREYGGHTMAAGLSLDADRIPEFRRALSTTISKMLIGNNAVASLHVDAVVPLDVVTLDLVAQMAQLAPFGAGYPVATLASRNVEIVRHKTMGRGKEHVRLTIRDTANTIRDITWWQWKGAVLPEGRFDIAYTIRESNYKDERELQLLFVDFRIIEDDEAAGKMARPVEFVDYRSVDNQQEMLLSVRPNHPDRVIWNDGVEIPDIETVRRGVLSEHDGATLVVWSIPPNLNVLQQGLHIKRWHRIILFSHDPMLDHLSDFGMRLAKLVKFRLNQREGLVDLEELASAMAHSVTTVGKGLEWLASRGDIIILKNESVSPAQAAIGVGAKEKSASYPVIEKQLQAMLEETAAFRSHYRQMSLESLQKLIDL